jgi:AP-4 complex subunit mu-1
MNYRTTHGFKPPFRVFTQLEADPASDTKALLTIRLGCQVGGLRAGLLGRGCCRGAG